MYIEVVFWQAILKQINKPRPLDTSHADVAVHAADDRCDKCRLSDPLNICQKLIYNRWLKMVKMGHSLMLPEPWCIGEHDGLTAISQYLFTVFTG